MKIYRAIKLIPKNKAAKSSFSLEADFPPEANLLKNLYHPGIPLIYDIDEDDDYFYMIEEFIQGESLDTFVLHQQNISQELIIKLGIQLCDILDYLHHYTPYPILYQDLKPEHIILCGNQLKLVDFGIASFFTGSDKHFQIYGTDGFIAPEALCGQSTGLTADIYGLGKILEFLANAANPKCTSQFLHIIKCATAILPSERYQTAAIMKSALISAQNKTCRLSSHLIRKIAVIGSRPGAGATHFAISLVCTLNKKGISSYYMPVGTNDTLDAIAQSNHAVSEQEGIYYYGHFQGIPDYGDGISFSLPDNCCTVRDYGTHSVCLSELETSDFIFFILSGGDWNQLQSVSNGRQLSLHPQIIFLCNHGNKRAAKNYARLLGKRVYCFPNDCNPYHVSAEKERLISDILCLKGGKKHFWP